MSQVAHGSGNDSIAGNPVIDEQGRINLLHVDPKPIVVSKMYW